MATITQVTLVICTTLVILTSISTIGEVLKSRKGDLK